MDTIGCLFSFEIPEHEDHDLLLETSWLLNREMVQQVHRVAINTVTSYCTYVPVRYDLYSMLLQATYVRMYCLIT